METFISNTYRMKGTRREGRAEKPNIIYLFSSKLQMELTIQTRSKTRESKSYKPTCC